MKVWTKVRLKDQNKKIEQVSRSLTNYLYAYGPASEVKEKYKLRTTDKINNLIDKIDMVSKLINVLR